MGRPEPNEATVQSVTNRALLDALDDPTAWIAIPSNVSESLLGYDARFSNRKLGVIQYKRAKLHSEGISASIDPDQHETLRDGFDGHGTAFYAFSTYRSYRDLDRARQNGQVLNRVLFVDAHDFPRGITTLRYRGNSPLLTGVKRSGQMVPFRNGRPTKKRPHFWAGGEWLDLFRRCVIGTFHESLKIGDIEGGLTGQTSFLVAEMG